MNIQKSSSQQLAELFGELGGNPPPRLKNSSLDQEWAFPQSNYTPKWVDKKIIVNRGRVTCKGCGKVHMASTVCMRLQLDVTKDTLRLVPLWGEMPEELKALPVSVGIEEVEVPLCHLCTASAPRFQFTQPMKEW